MKILWILLIAIGLAGCATKSTIPDVIISEKVIHVDPRALIPCKDLTTASEATFEAVLQSAIDNAEIYLDCRNKQNTSIKLLKEFANIKDKP
jgi:hypothetical protein